MGKFPQKLSHTMGGLQLYNSFTWQQKVSNFLLLKLSGDFVKNLFI